MKKSLSYCLKFIVAVMVALSMWSAQAFEHNRVVVNGQEYIDWSGATASSTIAILFSMGIMECGQHCLCNGSQWTGSSSCST
ncbi:MAG: hypothetical protein LR011_09020, partial [Verrucomicrobia bacterium]|nr:hypothetical protein [Verrucomicrobiota bacterium]